MIFTYMKTEVNVLFLHLYHEVIKYIFRQSQKSPDKSFTFSNLYHNCEAQGKGRARGRPRMVTQRSFIDYRLVIVDIDFPDALH